MGSIFFQLKNNIYWIVLEIENIYSSSIYFRSGTADCIIFRMEKIYSNRKKGLVIRLWALPVGIVNRGQTFLELDIMKTNKAIVEKLLTASIYEIC